MPLDEPELTARTEHENADTRMMPIPVLFDEPVAPVGGPAGQPDEPAGTSVQAVFCAWGHPNPPGADHCRVCTALIATQPPRVVPAPVLAVLRASNGVTVDVVSSVLVGRAPARDRARVRRPGAADRDQPEPRHQPHPPRGVRRPAGTSG